MKSHILIIGAGGMARAIAYDLHNREPHYPLIILDRDEEALHRLSEFLGDSADVKTVCGDASDLNLLQEMMPSALAAVGAASYTLHHDASAIAIHEGSHWVDLGGNPTVVQRQFHLHPKALAAGVSVIPDAGLAPGFVNIVGGAIAARLDEIDELHFRVGGLPQFPKPPLFYGLVFSAEGLANEYHEPAWVIEEGEAREVESLTGWERIHFGAPLGTLEAFHTSGGASTMIETFHGKVKTLDYKTLRYPGHLRKIKLLGDLGFWGDDRIEVADFEGGLCATTPRAVLGKLLERQGWVKEDLIALAAWGVGKKDGKNKRIDVRMTDYYDAATGLSAMARTTGFPAAILVRMMVEGVITARGVLRQETSVPYEAVFNALAERGVTIKTEERDY